MAAKQSSGSCCTTLRHDTQSNHRPGYLVMVAYLEQVVHLLGDLCIQAGVGVGKDDVLQALAQVVGLVALLGAVQPASLQ